MSPDGMTCLIKVGNLPLSRPMARKRETRGRKVDENNDQKRKSVRIRKKSLRAPTHLSYSTFKTSINLHPSFSAKRLSQKYSHFRKKAKQNESPKEHPQISYVRQT